VLAMVSLRIKDGCFCTKPAAHQVQSTRLRFAVFALTLPFGYAMLRG
jgi:hypothetical protein